jgi:hypothetical protein
MAAENIHCAIGLNLIFIPPDPLEPGGSPFTKSMTEKNLHPFASMTNPATRAGGLCDGL